MSYQVIIHVQGLPSGLPVHVRTLLRIPLFKGTDAVISHAHSSFICIVKTSSYRERDERVLKQDRPPFSIAVY